MVDAATAGNFTQNGGRASRARVKSAAPIEVLEGGCPHPPRSLEGGCPHPPRLLEGGCPHPPRLLEGGCRHPPRSLEGGCPHPPRLLEGGCPHPPRLLEGGCPHPPRLPEVAVEDDRPPLSVRIASESHAPSVQLGTPLTCAALALALSARQ